MRQVIRVRQVNKSDGKYSKKETKRNDFAYVGGKSRKSWKNRGKIKDSRKPSVFL